MSAPSDRPARSRAPSLVVIGNFDGVHLGHQAVLRSAVGWARAAELRPLVLTFDPHPAVVLRGVTPSVLTDMDRRQELIQSLFPEIEVVVERFTVELSQLGAREFVERLLVGALGARHVVVGANFRFGRGREGDVARLAELGQELGFLASAHPLEGDAGGAYSSSRVRRAVEAGDVAEARRLLGRPHALSGTVSHGDARGRTLGFPTANLAGVVELLPAHGVYACRVDGLDATGRASAIGPAVVNLGVRPTVGAGPAVEAHLLDFSGDLYGARLRVHLVTRLRAEQKFAGLAELEEQIRRDVAEARRVLGEGALG